MKNIKKIGFILCLTLMITTIMPSSFVTETVQAATPKVKLSETKKKISIGESFQLSLKSVKSSKVKWSSTDKQVATVSKSGKVKGKQEGNCVIIAKYKKNNYKCFVTIYEKQDNTVTASDNYSMLYNYVVAHGEDTNAGYKSLTNSFTKDTGAGIIANVDNKTLQFNMVQYVSGVYIVLIMELPRNSKTANISFYIMGQAKGTGTILCTDVSDSMSDLSLVYESTGSFDKVDLNNLATLELQTGMVNWDVILMLNSCGITMKDLGFENNK